MTDSQELFKQKAETAAQLAELYQKLVMKHADMEKQLHKERAARLKLQKTSMGEAASPLKSSGEGIIDGVSSAPVSERDLGGVESEELRLAKIKLLAEQRKAKDVLQQLQQSRKKAEISEGKLREASNARDIAESKLREMQAGASSRTDGLCKQIQELQADVTSTQSKNQDLKKKYDAAVIELELLRKSQGKTVPASAVPAIDEIRSLQQSLQAAKKEASKQMEAAEAESKGLRDQLQASRAEAARIRANLQEAKQENVRRLKEATALSVKSESLQVGLDD